MTRLVVPADVDYTTFDFDAISARLERSIPSVFPDWTDRSKANVGVIMLEGVSFIGDVLAAYQNAHCREAYLSVCTQMANAIRHARRLNYTPRGRTAATVTMQLTLDSVAAHDVVLTAGETIRSKSSTEDLIRVTMQEDILITAGNLSGTGSAEHSENQTQYYESNDLADQQVELEIGPVIEVTSVVDSVGTGSQVTNFLDSSSTDFHFQLLVDENENGLLKFGDGTNGRKPVGTVTMEYKTGGGTVTIDAGTLELPEFTLQDAGGNSVSFTITNPASGTGGEDRETVDEIRVNAPASLAATTRSVTQSDFETNAKRVDGVARALMLTADQDSGIAENTGQLYIVAKGTELASGRWSATTPTAAQLTAVKTLIDGTYPPTITFTYEVLAANFQAVNIVARIKIAQGYNASAVDTSIRAALADLFAALNDDLTENDEIDFGYNYKDEDGNPDPYIPWSDIFNAVRDATGVRSVDKSTFQPYDDVSVGLNAFPSLGSVTPINDDTGLPLV